MDRRNDSVGLRREGAKSSCCASTGALLGPHTPPKVSIGRRTQTGVVPNQARTTSESCAVSCPRIHKTTWPGRCSGSIALSVCAPTPPVPRSWDTTSAGSLARTLWRVFAMTTLANALDPRRETPDIQRGSPPRTWTTSRATAVQSARIEPPIFLCGRRELLPFTPIAKRSAFSNARNAHLEGWPII